MITYRSTLVMLVVPLFCTKGAAVVLENAVSRRNNLACFVRNFHAIGIHRQSNYCPVTAAGRKKFGFKSNMCTSSKENDSMGNSTDIFSSVGAAGNLRFKKSGVNPVDMKREEPNFKVKQLADETKSSQDKLKQQAGFHDGEFVQDILDSIANVVQTSSSSLKHSYRDNGKWRSITVQVPVQSAEQLYDVYAAIGRDPRVKFKF